MAAINKAKNSIMSILVFIFCTALVCVSGYLYKRPYDEQIRNGVVASILNLCVIFSWYYSRNLNMLDYNNSSHHKRFTTFYCVGTVFACILPLFPFTVWPVVFFAAAFSLFSNAYIGMFSYAAVITMATFLSEAQVTVFFLYFVTGAIAIILLVKLDDSFTVNRPLMLSLMFLMVMETATITIAVNQNISVKLMIPVLMNIILNGLLMAAVLKYFAMLEVHKYKGIYQEIIDPEFEVMAGLKEKNKDKYMFILHSAYFAERIAAKTEADVTLTKACAYYHRLGEILKSLNAEDDRTELEIIRDIFQTYEFPPDAVRAIESCFLKRYTTRESTIVLFTDTVVSSILYLFEKDENAAPNYEMIVNMIFKKKFDSGAFDDSELSYKDILTMKNVFIEEELYYDFLH